MTWYEKLDKAIEVYLPDLPLERDVPMSRYTSFRIGGWLVRKTGNSL